MNSVHNFLSRILDQFQINQVQVNKVEAGDSLPNELTTLVLSHLSYTTLIMTCPQVCRKWSRLANGSALWERFAIQCRIAFPFQLGEQVTTVFKKQIHQQLWIEIPSKTEEEFFNKIQVICSLMKRKEIIRIDGTGEHNKTAFNLVMTKGGELLGNALDEPEEKLTRIYRINIEKLTDFSLSHGAIRLRHNSFQFDIAMVSYLNSSTSYKIRDTISQQLGKFF